VVLFFGAEYYPLTPYSLDRSVWVAWQFNSPEKRSDIVEVFRRENSPFDAAHSPCRLWKRARTMTSRMKTEASLEFTRGGS
jgi:hypothetical protein